MKIWIYLVILLGLHTNLFSQSKPDSLSREDIQFIARYVTALEIKDSMNRKIISEYKRIDSLENEFKTLANKIDSLQTKQLKMYKEVVEKPSTLQAKNKFWQKFTEYLVAYVLGALSWEMITR